MAMDNATTSEQKWLWTVSSNRILVVPAGMVGNTILNTKKIKRIIGVLLIFGLKIKRIPPILLIFFVFNKVFSTIPAYTTRIQGLSRQP